MSGAGERSGSGAGGAAADPAQGARAPTPLCALGDLADGEARGFDVPGLPFRVILVRRGDRVHGWRDLCPHYAGGTPMAWKRDAYLNGARSHIACHAHGAWFEIDTGVCVQGPCLGRRLTRVPLTIGQNGLVAVTARAPAAPRTGASTSGGGGRT